MVLTLFSSSWLSPPPPLIPNAHKAFLLFQLQLKI